MARVTVAPFVGVKTNTEKATFAFSGACEEKKIGKLQRDDDNHFAQAPENVNVVCSVFALTPTNGATVTLAMMIGCGMVEKLLRQVDILSE